MAVRIHKVYGKTPKEARRNAQKEFGENISVIKMRPVSANRLKPDKATTYELTVAVENEAPTMLPLPPSNRRSAPALALQEAIGRVNTMLTAGTYRMRNAEYDMQNTQSHPPATPQPEQESPIGMAAPNVSSCAGSDVDALAEGNGSRPLSSSGNPQSDHRYILSYIGSELSEIRDVLHILLNGAEISDAAALPDEVTGLHRKFVKNDIESNLAHDLAEAMQECFHDEKGRSIHEHLATLLRKIVTTSGGIQFSGVHQRGGHRPGKAVVALVGATGVGKTTTLAKLAAQYQLQQKKIALITTDDYRIGSIEQLETYASILNVPMEIAHEPEALESLLAKHATADLILIDTPGRSQLDVPRLRSIDAFLNAACPTETYLLLNTTTRNQDLNSVVDRFGTLGVDGHIFTKLDEAVCFGSILNISVRTKKPIVYLTTGQDVANDIEAVAHSRLATFLLRGFQKRNVESN